MNSLKMFWPNVRKALEAALGYGAKFLAGLHEVLVTVRALPLAVVGALVVLILVLAWSCERQARRRESAEAEQVQKQAAAEVARLEAQAAAAIRESRLREQALRELESRRQKLAREAEGLRERLKSLHQLELSRVGELATLPTSEVASRVATRLGSKALAAQVQGSANRDSGEAERPPEPAASNAALALSGQGLRKVETAFVQLDACREQQALEDQQLANCQQRAGLQSEIIHQKDISIEQLTSALTDKDQILARREAAHRAELKAVRGGWRSRFLRAVEYFAFGVVAGVLLR